MNQEILNAIIGALTTLVTAVLLPLAREWVKTRTSIATYEKIQQIASIGVQAAEQLYAGQTGVGAEKFSYVAELLKKHDLKLDDEMIQAVIEALVLEIKVDGTTTR
ncbi:MAG: phage holin family protein [Eubacteriaceae bacterium]|nr:phage holin family protein [Eubacteriaceae bacterium]